MKSLIKYVVSYPIWSDLIVLLIAILGIISFKGIHVNFFPEVEQRNVNVQVIYPGASPQEMEEGIVLKIEEALKGLEGIEQITSVSAENMANVVVEGKKGYNPEQVLSDVKNSVDKINSFPVAAEKPVIYRVKPPERVMNLLLQADVDLLTLKRNAEQIEDDLLASGKVSQIKIIGLPPYEVSVEVSEQMLRTYNLTFDEIAVAIRRNNLDVSAGSLKSDQEEILIRSRHKHPDAAHIAEIIVRSRPDGSAIRLKDLGKVKEQFAESPIKSLYNGNRAITLQISKTQDEDLLAIADYVREYVTEYNETSPLLSLVIASDFSKLVRQRIDLLVRNGRIGLILVVLVLGFFLNVRLALWVAFAIPVSFLGMFIVAYLAGITINVISLFGMIMVVGILVDDGIVVAENIYSNYEKGKTPFQAAIEGTWQVFPSVFAAVMTTLVMFLPFFFLEGRMGELFPNMAVVVVSCLGFSLVESAFVLPAHLAHSKALATRKKNKFRETTDRWIDYFRQNIYGKALQASLANRYIVLAIALFFVFGVMGMVKGGIIKSTFFPFVDSDNISIELNLKPGTREQATEEVLKDIEKKVWEANAELSAGRADSLQVVVSTRIDIGTEGSEKGMIDVELLDGETRNLESFKISALIRKKTGNIPDAEKLTFGGRAIFGKPVSLSMTGKNLRMLEGAKERMKAELKSFPTLADVNDNNVVGKREINLNLKPQAFLLGLNNAEVARQIRQGFFGEEAQRLQVGDDEVKVWVRYPADERKNLGQLEQVRIKAGGREYPLTEIADYSIDRGIVNINHFNGSREIRIEADLSDPNEPLPPILDKIKTDIAPVIMSEFPGVRIGFEGQDKENQKLGKSAGVAFPLAFAVLILIIVLTFRAWSQMAMIIAMVPLGIFGAILGHGIELRPLSIFSTYGMIALSGIIVNDSVVFMDAFNKHLRSGMKILEAVHATGVSRFRAILLTSLTTVAGLYPLILEKSRQAQFLVPMAISVAWGLIFATFFTLFVLPNLILIVNDLRVYINWLWTGIKPEPEDVEPAILEDKRLQKEDR